MKAQTGLKAGGSCFNPCNPCGCDIDISICFSVNLGCIGGAGAAVSVG